MEDACGRLFFFRGDNNNSEGFLFLSAPGALVQDGERSSSSHYCAQDVRVGRIATFFSEIRSIINSRRPSTSKAVVAQAHVLQEIYMHCALFASSSSFFAQRANGRRPYSWEAGANCAMLHLASKLNKGIMSWHYGTDRAVFPRSLLLPRRLDNLVRAPDCTSFARAIAG